RYYEVVIRLGLGREEGAPLSFSWKATIHSLGVERLEQEPSIQPSPDAGDSGAGTRRQQVIEAHGELEVSEHDSRNFRETMTLCFSARSICLFPSIRRLGCGDILVSISHHICIMYYGVD